MPTKRLSMRKIREILRLRWGRRLSMRDVARSVGVSSSTVLGCLTRATEAGLTWPLPDDQDDGQLEDRLYPSAQPAIETPCPASVPAEGEAEEVDGPEVELTDKALRWIRERRRPRISSSEQNSRPRWRDRVDPAVSAEARAAGVLEFDARCPEASAEDRARFIENIEELIRKGGNAVRAVEAAMKASRKG